MQGSTHPHPLVITPTPLVVTTNSPSTAPETPLSPKQARKQAKEEAKEEAKALKEEKDRLEKEQKAQRAQEKADRKAKEQLEKEQKKRPNETLSPKIPLSPYASAEVQNSISSPTELKSALSSHDAQDKPLKHVNIAQPATATSDASTAEQVQPESAQQEPQPGQSPSFSLGQLATDAWNETKRLGRRLSMSSSKRPAVPEDSTPAESEELAPEDSTLAESAEPAPEESFLSEYDLTNKSTLEEAFDAAFTIPLDHDAAQDKFTQAAADYYLTAATPLYDDFKALLKVNLAKNAIHRTSSFCQVFLSVTGYIHIFTETDVAGMITREFADATMDSKDPHRKFVEIVLPAGAYSEFHCNGFVTLFNQLFRFRLAGVPREDIDRCYIRNMTAVLQRVDKRRQDLAQADTSRNNHKLEAGRAKQDALDRRAQELQVAHFGA